MQIKFKLNLKFLITTITLDDNIRS